MFTSVRSARVSEPIVEQVERVIFDGRLPRRFRRIESLRQSDRH